MLLKDRLQSVLVAPIVSMLIIGAVLGLLNLKNLWNSPVTFVDLRQADSVGTLVHALQVERGMSAGFIASGGVNFVNDLPKARADVDAAVETLPRGLFEVRDNLERLSTVRRQIDGLTTTVPEMAGFFTKNINQSLLYKSSILSLQNNANLTRIGAGMVACPTRKRRQACSGQRVQPGLEEVRFR